MNTSLPASEALIHHLHHLKNPKRPPRGPKMAKQLFDSINRKVEEGGEKWKKRKQL